MDDTQLRTKLSRLLDTLDPCLKELINLIPALRNALVSITIEALETHYEIIQNSLKSLLNPEMLNDSEKELIGLMNEYTESPHPKYKLMSKVPENWIPYIPVQTSSDNNRSIQLIQANMVRSDDGDAQVPIPAVSRILKSAELSGNIHAVDEEAVARHGLKIGMHIQRTRWIDGSTHVWIGRKVGPGRGEGSSGLKFDYLKFIK